MLSLKTKGSGTRFAHKLDKLFWWFVMLLPVFAFLLGHFRDSAVSMTAFFELVPAFPFIEDILNNVTELAFDSVFAINPYLSYCIGVEIMHVLFDIVVFIPRLAHKWIGNAIDFD